MKSISSALETHLAGEVTTVTVCWKVTREDTQEYFFTAHDESLIIDGDTYSPLNGTIVTELLQRIGMAVDSLQVTFELSDSGISEDDINSNLFDDAKVDVFLVNWASLSDGVLYICKEWTLGNFELKDNIAVVEVRGKAQRLQQNVVELCSSSCRAILGDSRCGVDLDSTGSPYRVSGSVTGTIDEHTFVDSGRSEVEDFFGYGVITWLTGNNQDTSIEVEGFDPDTKQISLFLSVANTIQVGDTYEMTYGCDKTATMCQNRFANIVNFRGEPAVPGSDKLFDYATPEAGS